MLSEHPNRLPSTYAFSVPQSTRSRWSKQMPVGFVYVRQQSFKIEDTNGDVVTLPCMLVQPDLVRTEPIVD